MNFMKLMAAVACTGMLGIALVGNVASAQAMEGRGDGFDRVHIAYYKTAPGRQDEWLAAYKKYHKPIMDYEIKKGVVLSNTMYVPKYHDGKGSWDFVIITVTPPKGKGPKLGMTRAELIKKLFPNIKNYVRGERRRWALTLVCKEGDLVEIDQNANPLSLYYPIGYTKPKQ